MTPEIQGLLVVVPLKFRDNVKKGLGKKKLTLRIQHPSDTKCMEICIVSSHEEKECEEEKKESEGTSSPSRKRVTSKEIVGDNTRYSRTPLVKAFDVAPCTAPTKANIVLSTSDDDHYEHPRTKPPPRSTIGEGVLDLDGGKDRSWVPDLYGGIGGLASVLDQAVFVREEEMEDVERPAMDLTDANGLINHFSYIQSWPDISKFQTNPFPLYDKLGDLYDGHIAEGNFNFTSIEATQVIDDDPEVERDETGFSFDLNQCEDDLLMYDDARDAAQSDGPSGATQSGDPIDGTQSDVTRARAPGGSNKKPVKEPKKKKQDDTMVEVMANYVEIKRKQAEEESALFAGSKNAQQFTITKCIIFLNAAAEDEVSAVVFLRSEMADLPRGI
ncbi:uncharacterized protein LOC123426195 [Hordeum vulgare subsp. vulgare]|uniref:uncharacterized protein LOC123426195 n=1 Tax=Hordeum vulgare subsp. vulgare TaxID=112509 RepID=UPI001D1A4B13|nr:uncharacterized protein LOC123426195 [Hordeum vulgare subsp. vulgare]